MAEGSGARRRDLLCLGLFVAATALVLLYPYRIRPENPVSWLTPGPGLYFEEFGVTHAQGLLEELPGAPLRDFTLFLVTHERRDSRNWGRRVLFSIDDGRDPPAFLIGQLGGRPFVHTSRGADSERWWRQFRSDQQLERGVDHVLTVTYGAEQKSLFVDGALQLRGALSRSEIARPPFAGRVLLGNAPAGRSGWWGELKGLAWFRGVMADSEIASTSRAILDGGVDQLQGRAALIALLPFSEGSGQLAADRQGGPLDLRIPRRFSARPGTLLHVERIRPRLHLPHVKDVVQNILLFVPMGWFGLGAIASPRVRPGAGLVLGVALAGAISSLAFEGLQLWIPERLASPADVLWNAVGTGVGAALRRSRTASECEPTAKEGSAS